MFHSYGIGISLVTTLFFFASVQRNTGMDYLSFTDEMANPFLWAIAIGITILVSTYVTYLIVGDWPSVILAVSIAILILGLIYRAAVEAELNDRRELARWLIEFKTPSPKAVGLAVLVLVCGILYRLFVGMMNTTTETDTASHSIVSAGPPSGPSIVALVLAVVILGPLIEELVFRGTLQRFLTTYTGPVIAILFTALAFAILHVPSYGGFNSSLDSLLWPISVMFVDSILWGYLYYRTENVAIPWIAHGSSNGVAVFVWLFV